MLDTQSKSSFPARLLSSQLHTPHGHLQEQVNKQKNHCWQDCYVCHASRAEPDAQKEDLLCRVKNLTTNAYASIATIPVVACSNATITAEVATVATSAIGNIAIVVTAITSSTALYTIAAAATAASRASAYIVVACSALVVLYEEATAHMHCDSEHLQTS